MFFRIIAASAALALSGQYSPANASGTNQVPKTKLEIGRFYSPNAGKQGTETIMPGQDVLRQPVLWGSAAKLDSQVEFPTSDGTAVIKAGTVLPAVQISNFPESNGEVIAYCTNVPGVKKNNKTGILANLGTALLRSLTDGRKCLYDKDGDGLADFAFLLDDGTPADRAPRPISQVALNSGQFVEAGIGDYVSIELRKSTRPSFKINIFHDGKEVEFDTISLFGVTESKRQSVEKNASFPLVYRIYGARFEIKSFDKQTGALTISWLPSRIDRMIPVPSEIEYSYRFGY